MKFVLTAVLGVVALVLIAGARTPQDRAAQEGARMAPAFVAMDERADCTRRGVAYFQQIGAYPRLSDGRDAHNEAFIRCQRSTVAF